MWIKSNQFADRTGQMVRVGDRVVVVLNNEFRFGRVRRIMRFIQNGEDLDCTISVVLDSGFVVRRKWNQVLKVRDLEKGE